MSGLGDCGVVAAAVSDEVSEDDKRSEYGYEHPDQVELADEAHSLLPHVDGQHTSYNA